MFLLTQPASFAGQGPWKVNLHRGIFLKRDVNFSSWKKSKEVKSNVLTALRCSLFVRISEIDLTLVACLQ